MTTEKIRWNLGAGARWEEEKKPKLSLKTPVEGRAKKNSWEGKLADRGAYKSDKGNFVSTGGHLTVGRLLVEGAREPPMLQKGRCSRPTDEKACGAGRRAVTSLL